MFSLTHQERKGLIFIGILILFGSILRIFNFNAIGENLSFDNNKVVVSKNSKSIVRPININLASLEGLESIPGVGKVIAKRIIDYRNQFGFFNNLEDLIEVKGIGDKKIEAIKKLIIF